MELFLNPRAGYYTSLETMKLALQKQVFIDEDNSIQFHNHSNLDVLSLMLANLSFIIPAQDIEDILAVVRANELRFFIVHEQPAVASSFNNESAVRKQAMLTPSLRWYIHLVYLTAILRRLPYDKFLETVTKRLKAVPVMDNMNMTNLKVAFPASSYEKVCSTRVAFFLISKTTYSSIVSGRY